jgi:hypothetical protein
MTHVCRACNRLICEGELVKVEVISKYHVLKSTVAYALDRDMTALAETLAHVNCQLPFGGNSDEN